MDSLSEKLEALEIDDKKLKIVYINTPLDVQKCFISLNNFNKMFKRPGQNVMIKVSDEFIICKIYPKTVFPQDILEINSCVHSVKSKLTHEVTKLNVSDITLIQNDPVLNEISVRVIFESVNIMKLYNDKDLVNILKQNLLKLFIIKNNCHVDLKHFPKQQRMGVTDVFILETVPLGFGRITSRTKINLKEKLTRYQYEQFNKDESGLYSMENHLDRLLEIVKLNELYLKSEQKNGFPVTKQVLLIGSSGCGKSSLVRLVANQTRCTLIHLLGSEVNKSDVAEMESSITDVFNTAFQYAKVFGKCIINLEDVDSICPHAKGSTSQVQRAVSKLLNLLDRSHAMPGIIVFATTNKPDNIDTSIRRHGRLETEFYIAPPTENERANILNNFIRTLTPINENICNDLANEVASLTPGYVGADLKQLCHTIAWKVYEEEIVNQESSLEFWKENFRKVVSSMSPVSLKDTLGTITTKYLSFDDLAGVDEIKKALEMSVVWPMKHAEAFARFGIPRPKGVLLHGPPGCGKTSLVRALVSLGTFSLLSISAAELYSPYVGDAERLLRQLFDRARQNSPCILFIDEIDSVAGSRGEKNQVNSEVQDRIIATLLTQMDGVGDKMIAADLQNKSFENDDGIIVIGATNRPDMVDAALLRPGRFDKHIYISPPNYDARLQIFKCVTKNMPLDDDIDFNFLTESTEMYSGADIKNICTEAALVAMTEDGKDVTRIKNEHFSKAMFSSQSSLSFCQQSELDISSS